MNKKCFKIVDEYGEFFEVENFETVQKLEGARKYVRGYDEGKVDKMFYDLEFLLENVEDIVKNTEFCNAVLFDENYISCYKNGDPNDWGFLSNCRNFTKMKILNSTWK